MKTGEFILKAGSSKLNVRVQWDGYSFHCSSKFDEADRCSRVIATGCLNYNKKGIVLFVVPLELYFFKDVLEIQIMKFLKTHNVLKK